MTKWKKDMIYNSNNEDILKDFKICRTQKITNSSRDIYENLNEVNNN